jgi:protein TonB
MVLTLALLIVAFRLDLRSDSGFDVTMQEQEVVQMEEILQTQQVEKPPPPPRPPVPVEVPNDEILEDEDLDLDASLDLDEPLADLPPPPPPPPADEPEPEPEIFVIVEQMPELIGGLSELQKKITYPEIAKKAGVEGRVIVQFVVNEQGNVTDPVVVRGIGAGCDEEAIRAVQTAKFTPGKQRGKPVRVKMSLPITFKLK